MVPRSPPIESRHNRRRSFRAGSPCEWRRDPPARRRAGRGRAPGFRPRPQAARTSTLLREKQMPHFLAEFAPGASKHLLGSLSFGWSPVADGRQQIGRAALPRYFSLGKTVAIVGRRTNTRRKQGDGAATETRSLRRDRIVCHSPQLEIRIVLCSLATSNEASFAVDRPLCAVSSTDRCNTFSELLSWGLIEQGLSGSFVELPCY